MSRDFVVPKGDGVSAHRGVSSGAKKTGLQGAYREEAPKLRVAAPSVGGRANAETTRFLAGLIRGLSGTDKTVLIGGGGAMGVRGAIPSRVP